MGAPLEIGPWEARPSEDGKIEWEVVCPIGPFYVALAFDAAEGRTSEATARLIATTPDLLAFVRGVAKHDPVFAKGHDKLVIAEARALVARATGEAP